MDSEQLTVAGRARAALVELRGGEPAAASAAAFWVPGRIEFLGKHTDYAGGRSLLCAVDRGICITAESRADNRLRIVDGNRRDDVVDVSLDGALIAAPSHWSTYPLTVARRIARDLGEPLIGADMAFVSNLPIAAGMSSSSALVVATFLAVAEINRFADRPEYQRVMRSGERLAEYLGAVENGRPFEEFGGDAGVGTFGGSEDHTAILCAQADALVQYSFCPVRFERTLALPGDHEFVIASSGVTAEKIGGARERYNRLSQATQHIIANWRASTGRPDGSLGDALASGPGAADALRETTRGNGDASDRLEHFLIESSEILRAGDALARGDLAELGAAVDRSQAAAERFLGNQIPETIWLARDARTHGATAASAFGAGFGGSVWALVRSDVADAFRAGWADRYAARFPDTARNATFFRTRAGPPATRL